MSKIGLFYGTQTGKTEDVAERIATAFGNDVTLHEIGTCSADDFEPYQYVIVGCPTWNIGELQADWEGFYEEDLDDVVFAGKRVAYFGLGDQIGYANNFQDAMGILEEKISSLGGTTVGYWPREGYEFDESKGLRGDRFVGLALDEDNQAELSDQRIKTWVAQLRTEFGL
jgi:flavodoxin I